MIRSVPWIPASGQEALDYLQNTGNYTRGRQGRRISCLICVRQQAPQIQTDMDQNVMQNDLVLQQTTIKGIKRTYTDASGQNPVTWYEWEQLIVLGPDERMQWNNQLAVAAYLGSQAGSGELVIYTEEV